MAKSNIRRKEILEKAARLFRKKGFAATSIRDIAAEVGMESASLYNHIKSKQDIIQSLLLPIAEKYVEGIKNIEKENIPAIQKLEKAISQQIAITVQYTDAVSLIPDQWIHLNPNTSLPYYTSLRDQYEKIFTGFFTQAIQEKDLRQVNVEIAMFSILSTLRRLYSWYSKNIGIELSLLERQLIINLLGGIRT